MTIKGKDVFVAGLGCVHVVSTREKGNSIMKIVVEAKLILIVPTPKRDDKPENVVLAAEQFINKFQGFNSSETGTAIGVRIHMHGYKTVE